MRRQGCLVARDDRSVELLQVRCWVHPELIAQQLAQFLVGRYGIRLPPGPGQRAHQAGAEPFAERVARRPLAEPANEGGVVSELEFQLGKVLEDVHVLLPDPVRLRRQDGAVNAVEGRSPPQGQGVIQAAGGRCYVTLLAVRAGQRNQLPRLMQVDPGDAHVEQIHRHRWSGSLERAARAGGR